MAYHKVKGKLIIIVYLNYYNFRQKRYKYTEFYSIFV